MFRSLLQTIPTISGSFTLACKLNNYVNDNKYEYTSYINDAILMPLDNNHNLTKDIKINLINGKYEYDVIKYFKEMSSYFYDDTYLKNNNIFETYSTDNVALPDNRDKNFEFGCKRISYNKYQYQFQFYAPIYINNYEDLPEEFVIDLYYNNSNIKRIRIPINKKNIKNKLRIYLQKFTEKITNNVPISWNIIDNKIIYKNAIDCKNGGFVTINSYNTINPKNINQTIINDIDNLICQNYKQNNIILSECIPLSFLFNINDIIDKNDYYYYNFNNFRILGYYVNKSGTKYKFYNFSTNYHNNYQTYSNFNSQDGILENKLFNIFDNDIIYSLHEGTNKKLYYQNSFKNRYCQWKLNESDSYIINLNSVFTYNNVKNKFPVLKNSLKTLPKSLFDIDTLYLPIQNYINIYNTSEQYQYNLMLNNNYSNWFTLYKDNNYINNNYKTELYKVYNNYAFINGIKYYINNDIKYFNIFLNPILEEYDENIIVGNIILKKQNNENNFVTYSYLEESNKLYKPINDNNNIDEFKNFIKDSIKTTNDESIKNDYVNNYNIYVPYDFKIKYIEYSKNIISPILKNEDDSYKISNYKLLTLSDFKNALKITYNLTSDDFDDVYLSLYNKIFNTYFKQIIGYQKINNILSNYTYNNFIATLKDYKLTDKIFYSLPNEKEKNNIYYSLINNQVNYQFLLNNNITLFIKKTFIELNNKDQFYINLFGDNGLYTKIYNNYYNPDPQTYNDKVVNEFIEILKTKINDIDIKWIYNGKDITSINPYYLKLSQIDNTEFIKTILTGFYNDLLDLIIYVTLYIDLNNYYIDLNEDITPLYKYIPYYNDNNIMINSDYFEQLHDNKEYEYLYTNINSVKYVSQTTSTNLIKKSIYVNINTIDLINYYINDYFKNYEEEQIDDIIYYGEIIIDNVINEKYKLHNLKEYIDNFIETNIINKLAKLFFNTIFESNLENEENNEQSIEELCIRVLNYIKTLNIRKLLNNYLVFDNDKYVLNIITIINDATNISFDELKNIDLSEIDTENIIPKSLDIYLNNLYIRLDETYLLTSSFDSYINNIHNKVKVNRINDQNVTTPIIIYKEQKSYNYIIDTDDSTNKVIIANIIYNDHSIDKCNNFKYQQLHKNMLKIAYITSSGIKFKYPIYVYYNPYNYLIKTTIENYLSEIDKNKINKTIYYELTDINSLNIDYYENINDDIKYAYMVINYHLFPSTNIFNIYNIDENDNFEIKYINNNLLTNNNVKNLFKSIYPYIKQDILINSIIIINNQKYLTYKDNNIYSYKNPSDENIKTIINPINIILPENIKCNINSFSKDDELNTNLSNIYLSDNIIKILYLNRYFGNIDPYFVEISNNINNYRSKIYIISDDFNINNQSNYNNVYSELLNIYNYNPIPYYTDNKKYNLSFYTQYEYKHFNDNLLYNLPPEISFQADKHIYKESLEQYVNKEKCFEYFKIYLKDNFINFNISEKENKLFLYIFNKYSIEYIQKKEQKYVFKNTYQITYKLTLI